VASVIFISVFLLHLFPSARTIKSKSHCDWRSVSNSRCRAPSGAHDQIFITVWQLQSYLCRPPSLMRGRVCLLYTLLALVSEVILGSQSLGTRGHIYCLRSETSPFVASYYSQVHDGDIRSGLHTGYCQFSVVTTLHGPNRNHYFQLCPYYFSHVYRSLCLETDCITRSFNCYMRVRCGRYLATATV
jgi:hypothetical protein